MSIDDMRVSHDA